MGRNVYKYEESADNNQSLLRLSPVRSLLILSSTMSIFNLFSIKHTFSGTIRTKPERKFAFFSLNTNKVKYDLNPTLKQINDNIKAKCNLGQLVICKFVDHDGKFFLTLLPMSRDVGLST